MASKAEPLLPQKAVVKEVRDDTADIKTLVVQSPEEKKPFDFLPGQCAMLSVPPAGEAIFSITSSPLEEKMEFSIKKVGKVTEALHNLQAGDEIGIRGPYGNGFPVEDFQGKDLLFIGGGIGLAPLHSVINYVLEKRDDYGKVDIVCGCRSPQDFVHEQDLMENWPEVADTDVYLTVDEGDENWEGEVGFVPQYLEKLSFDPEDKIVITCGPPIMIKFVLEQLEKDNFQKEQVYTTLELKMKCGIGKCGRCNAGGMYVCKDVPVYDYATLKAIPEAFA